MEVLGPRLDIINIDIFVVTFCLVADGGWQGQGGAGAAQGGGRAGGEQVGRLARLQVVQDTNQRWW